eukprot:jgi/Hompol1/7003/HPOL_003813-RA
MAALLATALACLTLSVQAFYVPGVAPHDYVVGSKVELLVNALSSPEAIIPYDYYLANFHLCTPEGGPKAQSESLGSVLFGDRLFNSPFEIKMLENSTCMQLCSNKIPGADAKFINSAITERYMMNWVVDGLPAATRVKDETKYYSTIGFPLGLPITDNRAIFNNHYEIYISYHAEKSKDQGKEKYRVVGVQVLPMSIKSEQGKNDCKQRSNHLVLNESDDAVNEVAFSYSVHWL